MKHATLRRIIRVLIGTVIGSIVFFLFEYYDKGNHDVTNALVHAISTGLWFGGGLILIDITRYARKVRT
jgi:hypothetical protein